MIPGWRERVEWSKEHRWVDNDVTRFLSQTFDEDIAIMIWDQYGSASREMLNGELEHPWLRIVSRFKCIVGLGRSSTPLKRIQRKLESDNGRAEIEMWLFNAWSD